MALPRWGPCSLIISQGSSFFDKAEQHRDGARQRDTFHLHHHMLMQPLLPGEVITPIPVASSEILSIGGRSGRRAAAVNVWPASEGRERPGHGALLQPRQTERTARRHQGKRTRPSSSSYSAALKLNVQQTLVF